MGGKKMTATFSAPWKLKGKGYILIYKFKKEFIQNYGNVPKFLKDKYSGGFGSVMLVDYTESNAGSYGELLFIPGKFKFREKKLDTISKIYVSTMESVDNGRNNWGIPKEQGDFKFEKVDENTEHVSINVGGKLVAEFKFKSGTMVFPVNTKLLPFPLVQEYKDKYYYTSFVGKGLGRFAKTREININPELFPDISLCKPIAVIKVEPFSITFPKAVVEDI